MVQFSAGVWLLLVNKIFERASLDGVRAVLTIYFTDILSWSDDTAVTVYHAFTMLCYLMPIFGAIIADTWWGKYKWASLLLMNFGF